MPMHDLESLLRRSASGRDRFLPGRRSSDRRPDPQHEGVGAPGRKPRSEPTRLAPRLSEHSAEILREAGFSADEIAALVRDGVTERRRANTIGLSTWISRCQPTRNRSATRSAKICARFDDAYWLKKDKEGGFPHDFHQALADAGWLGICMPEEYGGSGLGITEAAIMMQTIAESGAGMSGASAVHMNIFGLNPVVVFGTERAVRADAAADHRRPREGLLRASPSPTPGSTPRS